MGYVVERREVGGDGGWTRTTFNNIPDTRFKISGLTPRKTYEFRVAAVNQAGQGQWSSNSDPIVARRAPCAPRIDMSMLVRNVLVYQGEPAMVGRDDFFTRTHF